jgi:hypothetical protein
MKTKNLTLEEIRITGFEALKKHLGVVGMIRFLQYTDKGHGNYSKERHTWLGNPDLKSIVDEIERMKK